MTEQTHTIEKAPIWFWVISSTLLLWNLMGVMAFIQQMNITPEQLYAMSTAEQQLYNSIPMWATIAFASAVFGGALGCLLLLLRKSIATYALVLSLVGVIVQMYHSFFIANSMEVYGPGATIMPILVVVFSIFLVLFARKARNKGWIS